MDDITLGLLSHKPDPLRYSHASGELSDYARDVYLKIIEFIPESSRVLDVGCGTGELAKLIQERRKSRIVGIESDPDRVHFLKSSGFCIHACSFDMVDPKVIGKFDVIVFADVLEHLVSPGLALQKAHLLLHPGGVVVLSIPNVAHWTIRLKLLGGTFQYAPVGLLDATHLRFFCRQTIEHLFRMTGFHIESLSYTTGIWLSTYSRLPWRLIKGNTKNGLVEILVKFFPNLFCAQFIIKAKAR